MRRDFRAYLLGTVCLAAFTVNAQAGGLIDPMSGGFKDGGYTPMGGGLKDSPMLAPVKSGWYIRGDIGYTNYGNVGGYIGEHQTFVGSNTADANGVIVGDFDNNCRLGNAGDLVFTDNTNVAAGGDGYYYWDRRTDTGTVSELRYRPDATVDSAGNPIPTVDALGNPTTPVATDPNVNGNVAGIWERYDTATNSWVNVAAVYHDTTGNVATNTPGQQTVLVWDAAGNNGAGAWGDRGADGIPFQGQTLIDVVRGITTVISDNFLQNSVADLAFGREASWLTMAASQAGQTLCNVGRSTLASVNIDDTWMIGGGIGYNFNSNWRGDLTFDYHFNSNVEAKDNFLDAWGTTALTSTHSTELSSFVTLANLYYDFGDRNGFSPYVGGGLGFSVNRLKERTITCEFASGANTGQDCGGGTAIGAGDSNVSVAAAAMVGFSKAMTNNMKLDVGYRFLYMGDAKSANDLAAADGGSQGQLVLEDITAHEIRVGLRYEFGGR